MDYPWQRFWCPRDGTIHYGDDGYPTDPFSDFGESVQADLRTYAAISASPCLILLGETGLGKSHAIAECKAHHERAGEMVLKFDLLSYNTDQFLVADLFHRPAFLDWQKGTDTLTLLLDSFDECRVPTLAVLLADQLALLETSVRTRLRIRIACRTAAWPESLTERLRALWGSNAVAVYELVPLRKCDVATAAAIHGLHADGFLAEVDRLRAYSLAIKPITLHLLFRTFQNNGRLHATEQELYRAGVRVLCDETQERHDAGVRHLTNTEARYTIASRIAAITILSSRAAVWTAQSDATRPPSDVSIADLADGFEIVQGRPVPVDPERIHETLKVTGLFSSRGAYRMGWVHQSYPEFLAAEYMHACHLDADHVIALITGHTGTAKFVLPQFAGVASLLARVIPGLFERLLTLHPTILLYSDAVVLDDERRHQLVEALLAAARRDELPTRTMRHTARLAHLNHPGLKSQFRHIVADTRRRFYERYLALSIVGACRVGGLEKELLVIARNRSDFVDLRCLAISCLIHTASPRIRGKLIELAAPAADDPNDRVAGYAFRAIWPDCISADELFSRIYPKRIRNHHGSYDDFVRRYLSETLLPGHLSAALAWVLRQPTSNLPPSFIGFEGAIIRLACANMDMPDVLPLLARALPHHLASNRGRIAPRYEDEDDSDPLFDDADPRRRQLLAAMLPNTVCRACSRSAYYLATSPEPLLRACDFPWLLDLAQWASDKASALKYLQFARRCYDPSIPSHSLCLLDHADVFPLIRTHFASWLDPVAMDSEPALAAREALRRSRENTSGDTPPFQLNPPPSHHVEHWLRCCETGAPHLWHQVARSLTLKPDSPHDDFLDGPDITCTPGWVEASEATRNRIIAGARQYIVASDAQQDAYFMNHPGWSPQGLAAYQAFRFLWVHDRAFVTSLDAQTWRRWLVALLVNPPSMADEEVANYGRALLARGHEVAPASFLGALQIVLRSEASNGHPSVLYRFKTFAPPDVLSQIHELAWGGELPPHGAICLLEFLVEHRHKPTMARCIALFTGPSKRLNGSADAFRTGAVCAFAQHISAAQWPVLWTVFRTRPALADQVVARWSRPDDESKMTTRLTDRQIANLYIWIERRQRRQLATAQKESVAPDVDIWSNKALLQELSRRETPSACAQLLRIRNALPHLPWLTQVVQSATETMRAKAWTPQSPSDLLRLLSKSKSSFSAIAVASPTTIISEAATQCRPDTSPDQRDDSVSEHVYTSPDGWRTIFKRKELWHRFPRPDTNMQRVLRLLEKSPREGLPIHKVAQEAGLNANRPEETFKGDCRELFGPHGIIRVYDKAKGSGKAVDKYVRMTVPH